MTLSFQRFKAYDDRCGIHDAETYTFSYQNERDKKATELKKNKSVLFIKKKEAERFGFKEYWVTAHYGKHKDPKHKGWISMKERNR
jgi:hypothetical protein